MRVRAQWLGLLFCMLALRPLGAATGERQIVSKAAPIYPELAKKMRVFGLIRLSVSIMPSGEVGQIVLESGHPLLVNAACDAVRQWRFAAGPQATVASIVVRFDLPE